MKLRFLGILLLAGSLAFVAGCGGDDDDDAFFVPPTPTVPPVDTPTAPPVDTPTAVPPTTTPIPGEDTPTPSPTEEPMTALGTRVFTVDDPVLEPAQPEEFIRSGLFSSGLGGGNVISSMLTELILVAGQPDENGVAPLSLGEDTTLETLPIDGSFGCTRFFAAGSSGSIDCDGGTAYDVLATQPPGDTGDDNSFEVQTGLGDDAGPGAATLLAMGVSENFPLGSPLDVCFTAPLCSENGGEEPCYAEPWLHALTTVNGMSTKGSTAQTTTGENFSCENWTIENGTGMLVMPSPTFNALVGDTSNNFRLSDEPSVP